jgi:CheY-like chemotaxis protein/signal transduction histidine kinase/HAMP domain-containing protein
MKIVTKLFLGFTLVIIIAGSVGLFCLIQMKKVDKSDTYMFEKGTVSLAILSKMTDNFEMTASNMAYTLYEKDTTDFFRLSLTEFQQLEGYVMDYDKTISDQEDTRLYNELLASWQNYKTYYGVLREFAGKLKFEEGLAFRKNDNNKTRRSLRSGIANLTTYKTGYVRQITDENVKLQHRTSIAIYSILLVGILLAVLVGIWITSSIKKGLNKLLTVTQSITEGNLDNNVEILSGDEIGILAGSISTMQTFLRNSRTETANQDWIKTGYSRLNDVIRGVSDMPTFAFNTITELSKWLDAKVGAFYIISDENQNRELLLIGSYAYTKRKNLSNKYKPGEGLIGQAALEKQQILIKNVPEDYMRIVSGLGDTIPKFICITPIVYENNVTAVIELGTLEEIPEIKLEYIKQCIQAISISLATLKSKEDLDIELRKSKALAEELQAQQEELKASNEELEEQTQLLEQSEERLKTQQEELRVANEELEETNTSLQTQKNELTITRDELEIQAEELAIASKYKSEFLANMSHELRTPLNSLLILSKVLSDNKKGNLSKDQVESANVIYRSGNDLLSLINEILDLSKIEAGQMDLNIEKISITKIAEKLRSDFDHVVEPKGLTFNVAIKEDAPKLLESDIKRVEQIIKNLTSNAIKFTKKGGVTVSFKRPAPEVKLFRSGLSHDSCLAVSVTDTGIGIPAEKQKIIFEAFQQADGGTSREYGGTGLGLSISRELAAMLGGEIQLQSEPGKGSEFTVYLPVKFKGSNSGLPDKQNSLNDFPRELSLKRPAKKTAEPVIDDRVSLKEENSNSILIIEDDPDFARILSGQCHEKGFKVLVALNGEDGIKLATEFLPAAVLLDLHLPGISGWDVLETLKDSPLTRHIPVHIMSVDDSTIEAFRKGAIGYLIKPAKKEEIDMAFNKIEGMITRPIKDLLVIEDDKILSDAIVKLIGNGDVHCQTVTSGKNALKELATRKYDCIILDLGLPDMTGFELLEKLEENEIHIPPVIVYTGKEISSSDEIRLQKYAESIIIKGVKSEERLLDEASLFLHRMVGKFPDQKKKMIINLHDSDNMFKGKKILIVDDDMRNVFALSKVLGDKGLKILKAEDGIKALDILAKEEGMDLVIMDIMMPEMDGFETIRRIRKQEKFANLPVIALTAKAMKKDYEECIAAGANDYMSKPVDITRLLSMLRIWLYR